MHPEGNITLLILFLYYTTNKNLPYDPSGINGMSILIVSSSDEEPSNESI